MNPDQPNLNIGGAVKPLAMQPTNFRLNGGNMFGTGFLTGASGGTNTPQNPLTVPQQPTLQDQNNPYKASPVAPLPLQSQKVAYTLNGRNYNANGDPINTVAGSSATAQPVAPIFGVGMNTSGASQGAGMGGGQAPVGYQYDGFGNLVPKNSAPNPNATDSVSTSQPASSGTSPVSTEDVQSAMANNISAYLNGMQNNQAEQDAHNAYVQALNNYQNFNTNLTAGEVGQYGAGRPISLDTGRAAQIGFQNQIQQQTLGNVLGVAGANQTFALGQQQLQAQVGQNVLSDLLQTGAQGLTQQQINLSALAYTKMTADQQAQFDVQYFQTFGTMPPASITGGATGGGQVGGGTTASASGYATPTALTNTGSTPNMTSTDMVGYDISSYATDPNYASEIASSYQQATSTIGSTISPSSIQNYINQVAPNAPVTGQMIYNAALNGGGTGVPVDPYLLAAQEAHESQFGTKGAATSTMNPANIGNTGTSSQTMPSWQAGVNAQATWLAKHPAQQASQPTDYVSHAIQQVQSILPPGVSQSVQAMPNGIPYINLGLVPSNLQTMVTQRAGQYGIKTFTQDQVSGLESLGAVSQALNSMTSLATQQLNPANGGFGTAGNIIKNWWGSITKTNPALADFGIYKDSAIKSVQALAGGQGSGLRLNTGTIEAAVSNLPTQNDSLETALEKIDKTRDLLNNQMAQIFGNSDISKGVVQNGGHSYFPGDVVGNINGQTGTVNADGSITPNQ